MNETAPHENSSSTFQLKEMDKTAPDQNSSSTNEHGVRETNSLSHNGLQPMPLVSPNDGPSRELVQITPSNNTDEQHVDTCKKAGQCDHKFFKDNRGWLMIVAILAAGSTYQAGLNPPGSFWQDTNGHDVHKPGNPVLYDMFYKRYETFYYCNAISFVSSLVIIILLMKKSFYCNWKMIKVLKITMVLDLFSFMVAYAVGSCRKVRSSVYVFLLVGGVISYVVLLVVYYTFLPKFAHKIKMPCINYGAACREECPA